jgi:SAM-dependent methyltransferase
MTVKTKKKTLEQQETDKYSKIWENPDYRTFSPGEDSVHFFMHNFKPPLGSSIIDFGCGSGKASFLLAVLGLKVTAVDLVDNCLDADIKDIIESGKQPITFRKVNLWNLPTDLFAHYGYCTDVMEHVPTEKVDAVLDGILKAVPSCFFQIALVEDEYGASIGEHLHLTVKPFEWWLQKFKDRGVILYSYEAKHHAVFYVKSWISAKELIGCGVVNTQNDELLKHVDINIRKGFKQAEPHDAQEKVVMLLGGGPSLNDFEEEVIKKRKDGQVLITTNGTYNWALERGLKPSAQIIVDAREFNKRFVMPPIKGCKYLISSQCHPAVFDALAGYEDQIFIWHAAMNTEIEKVLDDVYQGKWHPVPGGSTVMLRGLPLLRMLGFKKFEIFGFDSCLIDSKHHAYEQKENDYKGILNVSCGDKIFKCHAWMASQAQEFLDIMKLLADEVQLEIYGEGLISYILQTGAEISTTQED